MGHPIPRDIPGRGYGVTQRAIIECLYRDGASRHGYGLTSIALEIGRSVQGVHYGIQRLVADGVVVRHQPRVGYATYSRMWSEFEAWDERRRGRLGERPWDAAPIPRCVPSAWTKELAALCDALNSDRVSVAPPIAFKAVPKSRRKRRWDPARHPRDVNGHLFVASRDIIPEEIRVRVVRERAAGRSYAAIAEGLRVDDPRRYWYGGKARKIVLEDQARNDVEQWAREKDRAELEQVQEIARLTEIRTANERRRQEWGAWEWVLDEARAENVVRRLTVERERLQSVRAGSVVQVPVVRVNIADLRASVARGGHRVT